MNKKILWITRTGLLIALLVTMQAATAPLGNTIITGSIVNLILVVSVMICGLSTGLAVALISPVCAKLFGIGPFWTLIPFIMAGNIALVLVWHFVSRANIKNRLTTCIFAAVTAALVKFVVLYVGVVKIAVPMILGLPEPQATVVSGMFSFPQLFTALIGGAVATAILPVLEKAIVKSA